MLADTRRLADSFAAIDYFERRQIPFIVALNCFDGVLPYTIEDVREALAIGPQIPVLTCDARNIRSVTHTLTELVRYAMTFAGPPPILR